MSTGETDEPVAASTNPAPAHQSGLNMDSSEGREAQEPTPTRKSTRIKRPVNKAPPPQISHPKKKTKGATSTTTANGDKGVIDLGKLDISSLKRYTRHFKLRTRSKAGEKAELLTVVSKHFSSFTVNEEDVIEQLAITLRANNKA
jgi:hypothetical protein